jgi:hypothetical protein
MHLLSKGLHHSHVRQHLHYTWKDMAIVDAVIPSLKGGNENFDLVNQGSIDIYLGLLIQDIDSTTFEMSQPFLIR